MSSRTKKKMETTKKEMEIKQTATKMSGENGRKLVVV
jgi:hypothetical protein